jgi:hypothetical protein
MQRLSKSIVYTVFCALALALPGTLFAQDSPKVDVGVGANDNSAPATVPSTVNVSIASSELPDSPGASWLTAQDASLQQSSAPQQASSSSAPAGSSAAAIQEETQKPQRPVGTAAAEAPTVNGVTAAEPAGVAIAPAKQRRVRTIVLKVGAIVGAGVAVGAVVALTAATSSKPPGAH